LGTVIVPCILRYVDAVSTCDWFARGGVYILLFFE